MARKPKTQGPNRTMLVLLLLLMVSLVIVWVRYGDGAGWKSFASGRTSINRDWKKIYRRRKGVDRRFIRQNHGFRGYSLNGD